MCTLTYLPHKAGYTLTHNRDERADRPTSKNLKKREINGHTLHYPEDQEAYGTWIASSDRGLSACLMNGGSKDYERKESYRHSRGLVVLDVFRFENPLQFYREYTFHNLEPFTLLLINGEGFWKITHDEDNTLIDEVDPHKPHIWSSTTLYSKEVREKRQAWFDEWLAGKPSMEPENIRSFHKNTGEGDKENDLVMSRWGTLKTLSITQISVNSGGVIMVYEDLVQNSQDRVSLFVR